ncbi:neuferricin [Patella vulgata]|uniref:neuferricin n=1 Tax=Patella vulgata TaxID=6465 RepID=UPI00217F555C|nr:neuferricin [Patella vulgata]
MAKCLLFLSILVVGIAVLFTVDSFKPYKETLLKYMDNLGLSKVLFRLNDKLKNYFIFTFKEKILTKAELAQYIEEPVYLAILGKVYDVTKGKRHYGKGGSYEGFAGKDGTRAFITGEFDEAGLIEDIRGFTLQEFLGLNEWQQLYERDYKYIGKVIGEFYDEKGKPTETLETFNKHLKEAYKEKQAEADDMKIFPPCNSEWSEQAGKRLWCTEWSGGIKRKWVGVPRQYLKAGKTTPRCACVNEKLLNNPSLKVYPDCDSTAVSCSFPS